MELNEALEFLEDNDYIVEAAMPEASKAVKKADSAIFHARSLQEVITALQELDAALPDMPLSVHDINIRLKHPKNSEPWLVLKPRDADPWGGIK